jgi:hypothetical protein
MPISNFTNPIIKLKSIFYHSVPKTTSALKIERPKNRVEPLQNDFKSTKELFMYAKSRCLKALNCENPYEHVIVADTQKNKILAEYIGDNKSCTMNDLHSLELDENSIIFHGHPISYPLSTTDIQTLIASNLNCDVAFNKKGEFSLAYKTKDFNRTIAKKACKNFTITNAEETYDIKDNFQMYSEMTDYILKTNAPSMGLRYVTNYKNLIAQESYKK